MVQDVFWHACPQRRRADRQRPGLPVPHRPPTAVETHRAAHAQLDEALDLPRALSPERILIGRQEAARVIVAIRNLPPRTREFLLAARFEDMTYEASPPAGHLGERGGQAGGAGAGPCRRRSEARPMTPDRADPPLAVNRGAADWYARRRSAG